MPLKDNKSSSIILLGRCNKLSLYLKEFFVLIKHKRACRMSIKFYRCDDEYGRNEKDAIDLIFICLEEHHYRLNLVHRVFQGKSI